MRAPDILYGISERSRSHTLTQQGMSQQMTRVPNRMTHGHSASIHVDKVGIDAKNLMDEFVKKSAGGNNRLLRLDCGHLLDGQWDHRECLVDLPHTDVRLLKASIGKGLKRTSEVVSNCV